MPKHEQWGLEGVVGGGGGTICSLGTLLLFGKFRLPEFMVAICIHLDNAQNDIVLLQLYTYKIYEVIYAFIFQHYYYSCSYRYIR